MKPLLFFCLALGFFTHSTAQYADSTAYKLQADYLNKSRNQKTAGWILLGGGAGLTAIGVIVGVATVWDDIIEGDTRGSSGGPILMVTGLASMAGSIPLFIAAGKNRRKAATAVSLKMEKTTIMRQWAVSASRYPAVALRFRL